MKTNNLRKLTTKEKEENYGGWAWLATAIPLLLQTIMTTVSAYKMLSTNKGSVKYDGADAHWEDKQPTGSKHTTKEPKHVFYTF